MTTIPNLALGYDFEVRAASEPEPQPEHPPTEDTVKRIVCPSCGTDARAADERWPFRFVEPAGETAYDVRFNRHGRPVMADGWPDFHEDPTWLDCVCGECSHRWRLPEWAAEDIRSRR